MKRLPAVLLLACAPAGCVSLGGAYPEKRQYVLEAVRTGERRAPAAGTRLRVRRFQVSRAFEGTELVTRRGELEYESDFYNVFFTSPASQVTEATKRWLERSGLFEHALPAASAIESTHVLEGAVPALYGDLRDPAAPKAVLEIQFFLVAEASEPPAILHRKTYRRETAAPGGSAEALVVAWSAGLAEILAELEADLARVAGGK